MHLARGVVEAEEAPGQDGHHVLLVVDVRDRERRRVEEVCPLLVPDAREAVPDEARCDPEVYLEVHGVE